MVFDNTVKTSAQQRVLHLFEWNELMKKTGFQAGTWLTLACVAVLIAGCSGDPTNSDVTACVLDASGHEKIGKEKVNSAMGIEFSRSIIDNVQVNNIIPQDSNHWLAQVSIRIGSKQIGLSAEDAKHTAEMFGWEEKNGFIIQTFNANYLLMKGSNGFTCRET